MDHGIHATVAKTSAPQTCAPKTCAPRAERVDNSARDSVPDTGRTLAGSPRR
ncbi:hypothetical protein AB0I16_22900 [Streptomyces sp. NPDC050703]|uniref:hypothetical protein n=1 Tax=Streptomyces sp. NPDC050703 TaxID=3157218 RepID=UPI003421AC9C